MADFDYKSASTAAADGSGAGKPKDPRTPNPGTQGGGEPKRKVSPARVIVAVLAAALVAFCAWSMSQYAQGRDPLAFASGSVEESGKSALLSAGKTDSSSSSAKASGKDAAKAKQIDKDTVTKALASLKLGKTDLAVTKDVTVVVTKDGIWVEHVSSATGESLVTDTSRQALALAKWVARQGGIAKVTWVEEDSTGVVRMSVTISSKAAAGVSKKDAATILSAASGYAIDKDTYSLLKQPSFSAEKGKATLPGGGTITVGSEATSKAEATSSSSSSASGSNNGTSNGSDSNSSSDITTGEKNGGANSASGNQSPAKPTAGKMTVSVSINGSSSRVSLSQGASAYDALLATGASVSPKAYPGGGTWVMAINGLGQDDSHGWTYSVNGSMPNVMSDLYTVHDGDTVVWTYVTVGD
jgi:hypothetical protein